MKTKKGFTMINFAMIVGLILVVSLLYGAASHLSGPIVSGTKAQGDTANVATGAGDIYAASDIEADGNLNVAGTATIGGTATFTGAATVGTTLGVTGATTFTSSTTINQILTLSALSYTPGNASTGTIYMDSSYVVKVCTGVEGSTRRWMNIGAQ